MADDSYSIKEFIADKFDNPETGVFVRLDRIDNKQATANGRTSKIEAKVKTIIAVASIGFTIILTVGSFFANMFVRYVAANVYEENKIDLQKANQQELNDLVEQKVGEALQQYK